MWRLYTVRKESKAGIITTRLMRGGNLGSFNHSRNGSPVTQFDGMPRLWQVGQDHTKVFALHGGRDRAIGLPAMNTDRSVKALMKRGSIVTATRTEHLSFESLSL
jgi:hypothetical protein